MRLQKWSKMESIQRTFGLKTMQDRYNELIKIINEANYNYHTLDNPTITDQEYDKYLRELYLLEEKHPELRRDDSPTTRAGGLILDGFKKVNHQVPMLSLSNVFNASEVLNFDSREIGRASCRERV